MAKTTITLPDPNTCPEGTKIVITNETEGEVTIVGPFQNEFAPYVLKTTPIKNSKQSTDKKIKHILKLMQKTREELTLLNEEEKEEFYIRLKKINAEARMN